MAGTPSLSQHDVEVAWARYQALASCIFHEPGLAADPAFLKRVGAAGRDFQSKFATWCASATAWG